MRRCTSSLPEGSEVFQTRITGRRSDCASTGFASYLRENVGDIFNLHNAHVLLFAGWQDEGHERLFAYEAGSPPSWKVQLNSMPLKLLTDQGYTAWRYRGMRD